MINFRKIANWAAAGIVGPIAMMSCQRSNADSSASSPIIVSKDNLAVAEKLALSGSKSAAQGLAEYFFEYGSLYPQSERIKWFLVAANLKNVNAMSMLSIEYYGNGNCQLAKHWAEEAIKRTYDSEDPINEHTAKTVRNYSTDLIHKIETNEGNRCL